MLSQNNYDHIQLLYNRFFEFNLHIKKLIEEENWDEIAQSVSNREKLLKEIVSFEKSNQDEIKLHSNLVEFKRKLIDLEKENIELIKRFQLSTVKDLIKVKQTKKILNAYEPQSNNTISTIEINSED